MPSLFFFEAHLILFAGYGGAVSIYFGLFSGLQLLEMTHSQMNLDDNAFTHCVVNVRPALGGSSYGGGVSVYVGAYSSQFRGPGSGAAAAAAGDTAVRNVSVVLNTARFTSCVSSRTSVAFGGNSYGGSFSFYIGSYAWGRSDASGSSSTVGATSVSGLSVSVSKSPCHSCSAVTNSAGQSFGTNAYGGSMSVLYIGGYAWSISFAASSIASSTCGATTASGLNVSVRDSPCVNCSALTTAARDSFGANSYGGSMSVVYIGGFTYSFGVAVGSNTASNCGATSASGVIVSVSNAPCFDCASLSNSGLSFGANSYGGSMSVLYIGGYAWSRSNNAGSTTTSTCDVTTASGLNVSVRDAHCVNCSALTSSRGLSLGANAYGGSMSVVYIGGYVWSFSFNGNSRTSSFCGATMSSDLILSVRDAPCNNCNAATTCVQSFGTNAYGGSMSVLYIGGYAWSQNNRLNSNSISSCGATNSSGLIVSVRDAPCNNCIAAATSTGQSNGANVYGGSMSVVYIGGHSWGLSNGASSITGSLCGTTSSRYLIVSVSYVTCFNCSVVATNRDASFGANSYGGSISAVYVGGYTWSRSIADNSDTASTCEATSAHGMVVNVSDAPCSSCSAVTASAGQMNGANAYGGSVSAVHVGGYAWSFSNAMNSNTTSVSGATIASSLSVSVRAAPCVDCGSSASSVGQSNGANSHGGSICAVYIGAYTWSLSTSASSITASNCGVTNASDLTVHISEAPCSNCGAVTTTRGRSLAANSLGGSMSVVYIGGYVWSFSMAVSSITASSCGPTNAGGLVVSVRDARCFNCSAGTASVLDSFGANAYGGSLSVVYIGGYSWGLIDASNSITDVVCGATIASGLTVSVRDASCNNCVAITTNAQQSNGATSSGGSMSVVYIGGYAWSSSNGANSNTRSFCGMTSASGLNVSVSAAPCFNCSAFMSSRGASFGTKSFGGSISAVYIGGYTWSRSNSASRNVDSTCEGTSGVGVRVIVRDAPCFSCSAGTSSDLQSHGANAYGGSMSVVYIGGYAWGISFATDSSTSSVCGATSASGLDVGVFDALCSNCSAVTTNRLISLGANSYGGSLSVVYVGGHTWSHSTEASNTRSTCGATSASGLNVSVRNAPCSNCSAETTSGEASLQANSYGGSMSAVYVGGYALSFASGDVDRVSSSSCQLTRVVGMSVSISLSTIQQSKAVTRKFCSVCCSCV